MLSSSCPSGNSHGYKNAQVYCKFLSRILLIAYETRHNL